MNPRRTVLAMAMLALLLLPLLVSGRRLVIAQNALARVEASLLATTAEVNEVAELRDLEQRIDHQPRPEEHVIAHVNAVLADAGIPSRRLRSLRPEADVAVPGSDGAYRRQSVLLNFQQLTLLELGRFLERWRETQRIWMPQRIELVKARSSSSAEEDYDVTIVISAIYLAESHQP